MKAGTVSDAKELTALSVPTNPTSDRMTSPAVRSTQPAPAGVPMVLGRSATGITNGTEPGRSRYQADQASRSAKVRSEMTGQ